MIDASLRDGTRQLTEETLPGIAAYSAGSGNLGSSRRGMQEGIAERGYLDRASDVGSTMRGNAYNQGLGLAERQGNVGLDTLANAATMHRNEEGLPLAQAGAMNDILLPIGEAFKRTDTENVKKGNLDDVLLSQLLFGGGSGSGSGTGTGAGLIEGIINGVTGGGAVGTGTGTGTGSLAAMVALAAVRVRLSAV